MLKKIGLVLIVLLFVALGLTYWGYSSVFLPNTAFDSEEYELHIPQKSSYAAVKKILTQEGVVSDIAALDRVAGWMNYKRDRVPSGRYLIQKGWNNKEIIGALRSGNQKPVSVTFNNVRSMNQLAGMISKNLSVDSTTLSEHFADPSTSVGLDLDPRNLMTIFIPNTYSLFWDVTPEDIVERMKKEHDKFWDSNDRKRKATDLNMTPQEIYTLASIVEKESQHGPERPIIAGLYLNRLRRDIALQADPTVVFANGDFTLRRVLNKHLTYDSPYNTYKYKGLPPGPIYMPSIQSIDAVLDYEKHDYLYMCAKPGYGTQHAFAKTLRGHNQNANIYRRWLNSQGIR